MSRPSVRSRRVMVRSRRGWLLVALAVSVAGCNREPGPGDACKPTDIRCVDPHTELACQRGVFIAAPCKGPQGCKEDGKRLVCDFTGNAEGDPCSLTEDGNARCIGEKQRITCREGKYTIDWCRGVDGCRSTGIALTCDQSIAADTDPCRGQTSACSADGKRVLACHTGSFTTVATCPGEGGCSIFGKEVSCDLGKQEEKKKK